ncbi:MAG TPA: hypothetical protein VFR23_24640 [Jiangellaceae bacterium]|nr:hypothetical protein [Jiangellaceae bacterium]
MAGISATAIAASHAASTADASASGFIVNERITLATSPTGSSYAWSLSAPSDSSIASSGLDDDTAAGPKFTPDVAGYYVVSVTVDGATLYVLRLAVAAPGVVRLGEIQNLMPLTDSQVPTPQAGVNLYYSSTQGALSVKTTAGAVFTINLTAT